MSRPAVFVDHEQVGATPPDSVIQINRPEGGAARLRAAYEMIRRLHDTGLLWFRATDCPERAVVVIEGWKVRPRVEPPFQMPGSDGSVV